MDSTLTAQELKMKGASLLREKTLKNSETFITVRGERCFAVLTMDKYNYFRECELEAAMNESAADLAAGRFEVQSVGDHVKDLKNV